MVANPNHVCMSDSTNDSTCEPGSPSTGFTGSYDAISDMLIALGYVLDVQEEPCPYHSWRVAALSTAMALEIIPDQASDVFFAALLHDIGAMGSFTHMVRYPTLNSQKSKAEVVAHPQRSRNIIACIPGLREAAQLAGDHHEWWNGYGYPARKSADRIPIGAQLIHAADSADLTKKLRAGSTTQDAVEHARVLRDIEIGPEVEDLFEQVIQSDGLHAELCDADALHLYIQELVRELPNPKIPVGIDHFDRVLKVFARVVDAKHCFTAGHSTRVSAYGELLASTMGLSDEDVLAVRFSGLVHDAGKVAVRRSVIDKAGPLSPIDFSFVKKHPALSWEILKNIAHQPRLAEIALHHHERWDGTGYPNGLSGEDIPLLSRLLAVADAAEAITSQRSYKSARSMPEALDILDRASGTQFDPQIVKAAHEAWIVG